MKHRKAGDFRDIPVPDMVWNMVQALPDAVETTLRFYIHASANAEARIGAMMNARWTAKPAPATAKARPAAEAA